ncbi:unnamed protein product [Cunninghamella blakesleeana]
MTTVERKETVPVHIEKKENDLSSLSSENETSNKPHAPVIKSEAEKKYVKKLNWTLLPVVWCVVFIQFADKSVLSAGAVLGMLKDTHVTPSQYGVLGSIFFVGYIVYQIPNSYLIQRLPIGKYLGSFVICWGIVTLGSSFVNNYTQLLACRILLGFFEAATYPCLFISLNSLYRRQEQSACLGFVYMSNGSGTIIGVLITYGIARTLDGAQGLPVWRWIFIIHGIMTIAIGIVTFFFLVDSPHSKILRLTEEEKEIVEKRTQDNAVVKEKHVKPHHYWEALHEPRFYLVVLAAFANTLSNGGLIHFSTPFVASLGFVSLDALLLQIPSAMMSVIFIFLGVYIHRKSGRYSIAIIFCSSCAIIGCLLLAVLPHTAIKLLGYYLTWGYSATYSLLVSIIANNVSGYSKKVFYNAAMMIASNIGNIVGPLVMLEKETPGYRSGMIVFLFGNFVALVSCLISIYLMHCSNKKRLAEGVTKTDAHLDLTDREDPNFIYKL